MILYVSVTKLLSTIYLDRSATRYNVHCDTIRVPILSIDINIDSLSYFYLQSRYHPLSQDILSEMLRRWSRDHEQKNEEKRALNSFCTVVISCDRQKPHKKERL